MRERRTLMEPRDSGRYVYLVFYFVGLTILFPYSMVITLTDFWYYKFRNTSIPFNSTNDELTDLQKNFPAYLSVTGNVPLTLLVVISAIWGHRFNIKLRLVVSGVLMTIAFAVTTLLSGLDTDSWQDELFIAVLAANCCYSSVNAVFQASFLGNIGRFPPRYIGSSNDGMGLGAVLPALVNIIILATGPDIKLVGVWCLSVAVLVMVVMLGLYVYAAATPFYIHHSGMGEEHRQPPGFRDYLSVLRNTWVYVLVIFVDYTLTLILYPAVAALVKPVSQESSLWNDTLFLPVCCFLLQACGDWVGRSIATFSQWPGPGKKTEIGMLILVILRAGFIPLLMRCNVAPLNRSTKILFRSDYAYVGILGSFSVLGGYIGNVGLMLGPKKVSLEMQEVAGTILLAALVFGLGVGSLLGPSLVSLL